ncbi:MAG TPA: two-component regulator propeller domain-containing protein [Verrucomicrobiae bacterium]|jgi:signal transduction histidine kinase/ligand-binding sensor domain-containing protein
MANNHKFSGSAAFPPVFRAINFARAHWNRAAFFGLLIAWLFASPAFASDPNQLISQMAHASWGAKAGVVDVTAITQTQDGYLWVATAEGLFQFDGIEFTLWQPSVQSKEVESAITVLCASRDGGLWMGGKGGINFLKNNVLECFSTTNGLPEGEVTSILEDKAGAIWVATTKGLAKFYKNIWTEFGPAAGLSVGRTRVELEDKKGNLWVTVEDPKIAGGTLLGCLRPGKTRFELAGEHFGTVSMVREAPDGRLWVAETSQSVRPFFDANEQEPAQIKPFSIQSKAILFDRDGMMWIGSAGQGLFRLAYDKLANDSRDEQGLPRDRLGEKRGLSSDFVSCAFEDREGNVWFGSAGGLDRFRNNRIVSWSVAEGLSYDQRLAITACSDGSLWAGSEQGLQRILGSQVETLGFDWIGPEWGNGVYSLASSASGDVWVGALNGLGHIKGNNHGPVTIAGGMELRNVTAITQDQEGGLWLCDQLRGVSRVWHDKIRVFPSGPQLPSQVVNAAVTDPQGNVWLGFQDDGISRYRDGEFQLFNVPQNVLALHCDRNGKIWAAGLGGLSRFENDHFETLETTSHFPHSELSGLVEDDQGYFWIASRAGLVRVTPKELDKAFANPAYEIEYDVYGLSDGLRGFPRHTRPFPIAAKSRDGHIWFATTAGLAMIDPTRLKKSANFPPVHITQASVNGKELLPTSHMELPAGTKDIKINYTAPSFFDPERIQFKCKLAGYDEQWREAGTTRQMAYSGLEPKNYEFQVMVRNRDGIWGDIGATWKFSIQPAFYQTGWFFMTSLIAGGLVLFGFYRWNLSRATARTEGRLNARLEAQMDERKRIAQELHDTLLQGFTGVRLKLFAISHRLNETPSAVGEQLKLVLKQTEQCLAEARRSVWALRSQSLEEADLAAALSRAVSFAISGTGLKLDLKVAGKPRQLSNIVEFNLLRICEEAVANIIKHANACIVTVELQYEARHVVLRVSDNGCGFNSSDSKILQEEHFGLSGMRERAQIIGGTLEIQSTIGNGTQVILKV